MKSYEELKKEIPDFTREEYNELLTICQQLKMKFSVGKMRLPDTLATERFFRLLQCFTSRLKKGGEKMTKEKSQAIVNKLFEGKEIRTLWDAEKEEYFFSVVDVVEVLTESIDSSVYWRKLKQRLKEEGNETVTNCHGLKMKSSDGKMRMTDTLDTEGLFRLIQSIPSPKAEPFKLWLAKLGRERIDETFDPEIAIHRAVEIYRSKGYPEEWIDQRLRTIKGRNKLTKAWNNHGIDKHYEYAILTDEIYQGWSGMKAKEYKQFKNLTKHNLRDNMTDLELAVANVGEVVTKELVNTRSPDGLKENKELAQEGGEVANNTRMDIEKRIGAEVVVPDNNLKISSKQSIE